MVKNLNFNDKYLVLASDGVWECFTSKMAVSKIAPYFMGGRIDEACKAIVKKSKKHWNDVSPFYPNPASLRKPEMILLAWLSSYANLR